MSYDATRDCARSGHLLLEDREPERQVHGEPERRRRRRPPRSTHVGAPSASESVCSEISIAASDARDQRPVRAAAGSRRGRRRRRRCRRRSGSSAQAPAPPSSLLRDRRPEHDPAREGEVRRSRRGAPTPTATFATRTRCQPSRSSREKPGASGGLVARGDADPREQVGADEERSRRRAPARSRGCRRPRRSRRSPGRARHEVRASAPAARSPAGAARGLTVCGTSPTSAGMHEPERRGRRAPGGRRSHAIPPRSR